MTQSKSKREYDYIIAGGGMAGLSLAFYLNESTLKDKTVLIIDRERKERNDHTWCFWETENSAFESIVFRKWKSLFFHAPDGYSELFEIDPFEYKMIRAIDFYEFIRKKLSLNGAVSFLEAEIKSVGDGVVSTTEGEYKAVAFVFDSQSQSRDSDSRYHNLLQHFLGWTVKTEEPVFDPSAATIFDFRVEQENDCRFAYVLPFSKTEALIEFTVFSKEVLKRTSYEESLSRYISGVLRTKGFELLETEYGVIPMSDEPISCRPSPKTIRIGTAGGFIKPSTGYSFQRTQRRLLQLVAELESIQMTPNTKIGEYGGSGWKRFLDSVLLNVLENGTHPASDVFSRLFAANGARKVLRFLDEDTTLLEDLGVMNTVPLIPFSKAALREARVRIFR